MINIHITEVNYRYITFIYNLDLVSKRKFEDDSNSLFGTIRLELSKVINFVKAKTSLEMECPQ